MGLPYQTENYNEVVVASTSISTSDPLTDLYNLEPNDTNSTAITTQIENNFKPAWWLDYTNTYTNGSGHGRGTNAFGGGVLAPNGKVILVPINAGVIGICDPTANNYSNGPAHGAGSSAFYGGVLARNGKVILVPRNATIVGIYDPTNNTYTNGPVHGRGTGAFTGGEIGRAHV